MDKSVLRCIGVQGSSLQHPLFPQCFVFYCIFQLAPLDLQLFVVCDCNSVMVVVITKNHEHLDLPTGSCLLMTGPVHSSPVRCKMSA